jgi:hypothetical protein
MRHTTSNIEHNTDILIMHSHAIKRPEERSMLNRLSSGLSRQGVRQNLIQPQFGKSKAWPFSATIHKCDSRTTRLPCRRALF